MTLIIALLCQRSCCIEFCFWFAKMQQCTHGCMRVCMYMDSVHTCVCEYAAYTWTLYTLVYVSMRVHGLCTFIFLAVKELSKSVLSWKHYCRKILVWIFFWFKLYNYVVCSVERSCRLQHESNDWNITAAERFWENEGQVDGYWRFSPVYYNQ